MQDVVLWPVLQFEDAKPEGSKCRVVLYGSSGRCLSCGPWIKVSRGSMVLLHPLSYALTPEHMLASIDAPPSLVLMDPESPESVAGAEHPPRGIYYSAPPSSTN